MELNTMEPKAVVEAYWQAMQSNDFAKAARWLCEDYVCDWPQSGERIAGRCNFIEINRRYPAAGPWSFDVVRLLEQGGEVVVWESMACALYIARHHGQPDGTRITPANAREDAEVLRWSFWVVNECEADALTVLMHRMVMPAERRKPELATAAEKRLAVPLRMIERHLQQQQERGETYLAASRFTVADLCVASVLNWARAARSLMAEHPLTHDWIVRCIERPAHLAAKALGEV